MDSWIELARGPLFRISLVILVLGLAYRFSVAVAQIIRAWTSAGDRQVPGKAVLKATLGWMVPRRLLNKRPLYSAASFLFHVGILVVPLFFLGHVALLRGYLPGWWPVLGPVAADTLTLIALVALVVLIGGRLGSPLSRKLSRTSDVVILVVLFLLVGTGFLASHPAWAPVDARFLLLAHMLLGNLALVLTPLTKIAHCVLFPLTQLIFQLGWHFPAESGRHVAVALSKEEEPV